MLRASADYSGREASGVGPVLAVWLPAATVRMALRAESGGCGRGDSGVPVAAMEHPGRSRFEVRRRLRAQQALLQGSDWSRSVAAVRARELAAASMEAAALELRRGGAGDERMRALVERALRRLRLVVHLES